MPEPKAPFYVIVCGELIGKDAPSGKVIGSDADFAGRLLKPR